MDVLEIEPHHVLELSDPHQPGDIGLGVSACATRAVAAGVNRPSSSW